MLLPYKKKCRIVKCLHFNLCFGPPAMSEDLLLGRAVLPHLSLLKWGLPRTLLVLATVHRPFAGLPGVFVARVTHWGGPQQRLSTALEQCTI